MFARFRMSEAGAVVLKCSPVKVFPENLKDEICYAKDMKSYPKIDQYSKRSISQIKVDYSLSLTWILSHA